jgi:hypothetical protein
MTFTLLNRLQSGEWRMRSRRISRLPIMAAICAFPAIPALADWQNPQKQPQFGLKLQPAKGETLVIHHLERPTEN